MTSLKSQCCLLLILIVGSADFSFGQDLSWNQPYSGNIAYGPIASSPGELPNCPECDCEKCKPCGPLGIFKRLMGKKCKKVQATRHEMYFYKQIYHTSYTEPVLPPYCEAGYGYYETSWRQSPVAAFPCDAPQEFLGISETHVDIPPTVIPIPEPAKQPEQSGKLDLMKELDQEKTAPKVIPNPIPDPPKSNAKPPYEPPSKTSAIWQQFHSPSERLYVDPARNGGVVPAAASTTANETGFIRIAN